MKRRRHSRLYWLCTIVVVMIVLWPTWSWFRRPAPVIPAPRSQPELDHYVHEMARQAVQDERNRVKKSQTGGCRNPIPLEFWDTYYLVQYIQEKLIRQGSVVIEPLLRILEDPNEDYALRERAAWILAYYDDPRIVPALLDAGYNHRLTKLHLGIILDQHLPVPSSFFFHLGDGIFDWLKLFIQKDYGEARLGLLDRAVYNSYQDGGLLGEDYGFPSSPEISMIRWFNRYYDFDYDTWLQANAPSALLFRRKQLEQGYDPAHCFYGLFNPGRKDEGINAVFLNPMDRSACRVLLDVTYPYYSAPPPEAKGWIKRFRQWYSDNRPFFVYDFQKHRFIVQKPDAAASRPALSPTTQPKTF